MTRDWSITAWGEDGPVEVTVLGKGESQHFPFLSKNDELLPTDEGSTAESNTKAKTSAALVEEW